MSKYNAVPMASADRRVSPLVVLTVAAAAMLAALVTFATPSFAGKPTGGGGSTSLAVVNTDSADTTINYGDTVTFTVNTTATTKPMVKVDCSQGGTAVYWSSAGFYADYPWQWAQNFLLKSDYWTGGAASCIATLYYESNGKFHTISTLSFAVAA